MDSLRLNIFLVVCTFILLNVAISCSTALPTSSGSSAEDSLLGKESLDSLNSVDLAKWKRGINLGRKMMCQIDHRNCGSFNEAKRFGGLESRMNPNLVSQLLKNALIQTAMDIQEK